mmetsp:Transcript_26708/g.44121  ORF Transcript_26708/g.44121 Transcript_26708/m.44121 type:complete len:101 (-) Transcript_26708:45-347(-)
MQQQDEQKVKEELAKQQLEQVHQRQQAEAEQQRAQAEQQQRAQAEADQQQQQQRQQQQQQQEGNGTVSKCNNTSTQFSVGKKKRISRVTQLMQEGSITLS